MLNRRVSQFLSKIFSLTVPKKLSGNPSGFQKIFYNGKKLWITEGISRFSVGNFFSQCRTIYGEPFNVWGSLGYPKNFMFNMRASRFLSEKTTLTVLKNFVVGRFVFSANSRMENFMDRKAVSRFSISNF